MSRAHERMLWLLGQLCQGWKYPSGFTCAWDEDLVDAFMVAFPESRATTKHYTMGPPSVPMLNRAAVRACGLGYLDRGHVGNQDARSYNRRTWCRTWTITRAGRAAVTAHRAHVDGTVVKRDGGPR